MTKCGAIPKNVVPRADEEKKGASADLLFSLFQELLHFLFGQAPERHVEDVIKIWARRRAGVQGAVALVSVAIVVFFLSL